VRMSQPPPARPIRWSDVAAPFLIWRSVMLYALSLHAVASAHLAWPPKGREEGLWLAGMAASLAVAVLVGEWLSGWTPSAQTRTRIRASVGAAYAGTVVLALGGVLGAADPALLRSEVTPFAVLQHLFLLLRDLLGGSSLGALTNGLVLVVLAALRGGVWAAAAVTGYLALLVFFLCFDHFARQLSAHPIRSAPPLGTAVREAAGLAGPLVLAMSAFFTVAPATQYAALVLDGGLPAPLPAEVAAAYRRLLFLGLVGSAVVFLAVRLFRRGPAAKPPTSELVEPERATEEVLPPPEPRERKSYPGHRGRIVRAYMRFLLRAAGRGLRRRPGHTPAGLAALVGEPAATVSSLTGLFLKARYGPDEPTDADARAAEADSEAIAVRWRRTGG